MRSSHLLLEEPIRMASILEPSKPSFFPAMTKIVGTLGPKSRSVDIISGCLKAGMSVARFDFSWGDTEFHPQSLENLKVAIKSTEKLCAEKQVDNSAASEIRQPSKAEPVAGEFGAETKPANVTFRRYKDESFASLKLEPHPVVLWQVYAISGILIMKWAWTRWNEQKGRKKPSSEEPSPATE